MMSSEEEWQNLERCIYVSKAATCMKVVANLKFMCYMQDSLVSLQVTSHLKTEVEQIWRDKRRLCSVA